MDIKQTFINLTKFTYPYGTEYLLEKYLPKGAIKDKCGNYYYQVGNSDTIFTCHLDTVCKEVKKVNHIFDKNIIKTDGTTNLGADDKAGMTVMLYMISKNVPGLYYFFIGEEVGCIGSSNLAYSEDFSKYKRCVSFDRRGYGSVITHQLRGRCCSKEFADKLSSELSKGLLEFAPDSTGIVTDSASFMSQIPECTNISVGYFKEHTVNEHQDILYLKNLCDAVVGVNWEDLPCVRDPKIYKKYYYEGPTDDDYYFEFEKDTSIKSAKLKVWVGYTQYLVTLTPSRLIQEKAYILEWVRNSGSYTDFKTINWDGKSCYIDYGEWVDYLGERDELIHVIDELTQIPISDMNILKTLR